MYSQTKVNPLVLVIADEFVDIEINELPWDLACHYRLKGPGNLIEVGLLANAVHKGICIPISLCKAVNTIFIPVVLISVVCSGIDIYFDIVKLPSHQLRI